jgi:serine/threonine protein kinase
MNIVEGVARGLAYMHHDVSPPLLHRNLKAANVLLRGSARALEACIGDFGLACLMRDAGTSVFVSR